jgi:hypothetical protein
MSTLGFCWSRETEQPKSLWLLSKQTASSWCHKRLHVTLGKASTTEAVKGSPVSMHGHKSQVGSYYDRGRALRRFVHSVRGGFYRRERMLPFRIRLEVYFSSHLACSLREGWILPFRIFRLQVLCENKRVIRLTLSYAGFAHSEECEPFAHLGIINRQLPLGMVTEPACAVFRGLLLFSICLLSYIYLPPPTPYLVRCTRKSPHLHRLLFFWPRKA